MSITNSETRIKKNSQGHRYIPVSYDEMILDMMGLGQCDLCSKTSMREGGYYIPVLNRCYCEECFNRWSSQAEFYKEDILYEDLNIKKYSAVFI